MQLSFGGRFRGYNRQAFARDVISGLIVGVVAIPLGMAFAIASGVKPEYGLYTTIAAGVAISVFGGSRFQIGGPTGAFIPVLFAIVMQYGYEKLLVAGAMAGAILCLAGLLRLGTLIRFIPRPVIIGFTAGIAVTIFSGQIANFLGLQGLTKHEHFLANMREIAVHLGRIDGYSVLTAVICLACILLTPRLLPKVPGSLVGLIVSAVIAALLFPDEVATIGSAYGDIPRTLPAVRLPELSPALMLELLQPALIIAMLGGIESLLSAVVADGMTGTRHNSNRELVGQGIANMIAPLFGGIPATGAIARTATNINNGAASPVAGIVHGLFVLLVMFLLAPYASAIPLASMAPILMVVAWHMSERHSFVRVMRTRSAETVVLLATFALTVIADLTLAVGVGLVLSGIVFVKHMSGHLHTAQVLPDPATPDGRVSAEPIRANRSCPQLHLYSLEGALFFGAAGKLEDELPGGGSGQSPAAALLLLRMGGVPYMDATGAMRLAEMLQQFRQAGGTAFISELQPQPLRMLLSVGLDRIVPAANRFEKTGPAIAHALTHVSRAQCAGCRQLAFRECGELSGQAAHAGRERATDPARPQPQTAPATAK